MIVILFNTILLILDTPWNDPNGNLDKLIGTANYLFTIIFLFEAFLKIFGLGLIFHYKNPTNKKSLLNFFETKENSKNFYNNQNNPNSNLNMSAGKINSSNSYLLNKTKNFKIGLKNDNRHNLNKINNHSNLNNNQNIYTNLINSFKKIRNQKLNKNDHNAQEDRILTNNSNNTSRTMDTEMQDSIIHKESAYLCSVSNCIDFFVVILGIIDIIDNSSEMQSAKYFKTLRLIRSLRPIRIFTKSKNLKIILACLLKSIPAIGSTFIICGVFIYIYIIIGIGIYKSQLTYICSIDECVEQSECIAAGGLWVYNNENFDNFLNALRTLFGIMMVQGWVEVANKAYRKTKNAFSYLYFITFIIFGYLFVLNLIISVVIEKYKSLKNKNSKFFTLSDEEKEWIKVQKIMLKFRPIPKIDLENASEIRKNFYKQISTKNFENFITLLIVFSMILLIMQHNGASPQYNLILDSLNYIINIIFNVELLVKLYVFRSLFFYSYWNKMDFFIILLCNSIMIFNIMQYTGFIPLDNQLSNFAYIFRALRILRVIRLMTVYSKLRGIIDTLIYLVPSVINIGIIMLIIIVIYGCIGVNLFSTLPLRENFHVLNNFKDFISAFVLLFKILTGEDWNLMMYEAAYHECTGNFTANSFYAQDYFCDKYKDITCTLSDSVKYEDLISGKGFSCGTNLSYLYFISFMIIGPIFIMNLCIVMVVEGFSESMYENESLLSQDEIDKFISVWINYDTTFKKKVHPHELVLILKQLQPPLGFNYDRFYIVDPIRLNYSLKKVRNNKKLINLYEKIFKIEKPVSNLNKLNNIGGNELEVLNSQIFLKNNNNELSYDKNNDNVLKNKEKNDKENILDKKSATGNNSRNFKTIMSQHFKNQFDEQFAKQGEEKENRQINRLKNYIKNGTLKRLKHSFEIQNFFFSLNKKFWTTNMEILQIMNIFKFAFYEEKEKMKSGSESAINKIDPKVSFIDDGLYIHFVDACLALSRLVVSKKNTISLDMLRENVVGKFTQKLWKKKFKNDKQVDSYFRKNQPLISEKISYRIISKVKGNLMEKLRGARERIEIRKKNEQEELSRSMINNANAVNKNLICEDHINYDLNNTILKSNELSYYMHKRNSSNFSRRNNFKENENKYFNIGVGADRKSLNRVRFSNNDNLHFNIDGKNKFFNKGKNLDIKNFGKLKVSEDKSSKRVSNKNLLEIPFVTKQKTDVYQKIYKKQQTNIEFYRSGEIKINDLNKNEKAE
jgi:hypothetical protein